jgi:hypothetical protein
MLATNLITPHYMLATNLITRMFCIVSNQFFFFQIKDRSTVISFNKKKHCDITNWSDTTPQTNARKLNTTLHHHHLGEEPVVDELRHRLERWATSKAATRWKLELLPGFLHHGSTTLKPHTYYHRSLYSIVASKENSHHDTNENHWSRPLCVGALPLTTSLLREGLNIWNRFENTPSAESSLRSSLSSAPIQGHQHPWPLCTLPLEPRPCAPQLNSAVSNQYEDPSLLKKHTHIAVLPKTSRNPYHHSPEASLNINFLHSYLDRKLGNKASGVLWVWNFPHILWNFFIF